ncbi:MAG TPA: class II fructose-bisphosphatase [Anaerolineae bacterium]|nr:class II fructose-bisphosphatase [Anaerolineae bacterium]
MGLSIPPDPDRNLALELVRCTEAAALAAGRWMGRGDKNAADQAAVTAMRTMFNTVSMDGVVVIGEGEKDQAPMLYNGERLGSGEPPLVDIAVDPIDGTRLTALGLPGAIAVAAVAERGVLYNPQHIVYMNKIAVGPGAKGAVSLDAPVKDNLRRVAKALGKDLNDLTVVVLDRPRHDELLKEIRMTGARIKLIPDGDVSGGLLTAAEDGGVDILLGIGGSPEAVITACALKCLGGEIQCKLWPRDEAERRRARELGMDLEQVFTTDDLVGGDNVFFVATGVTDGEWLSGVKYTGTGAHTSSVVMRSRSGTVRTVEARHRLEKLAQLTDLYG